MEQIKNGGNMNTEQLIDLLDAYIEIKIFNARCREEGVDESTKLEREAKLNLIKFIENIK